jgi:hypothetical protein
MEKWASIRGYGGWYDVSDHGNIRSWKDGKNGELDEPKTLKTMVSSSGYVKVDISHNGIKRRLVMHELVAASFIGDRPNGMHIDHIDEDKTNNHVSNLEYVTPRANCQRYHENNCGASKAVGVSRKRDKWASSIYANGKLHHIMVSDSEDECSAMYKLAVEHLEDGYDSLLRFIGDIEEHIDEYRGERI